MLDPKVRTLLAVVETGSFTKAAGLLSLTQPAVSHHIGQLEQELGIRIFIREKGRMSLTKEGEIVTRCARRLSAMYARLHTDLKDAERNLTRLRVGITHTAESNLITEVLARFSHENSGILITITTDTINNLYEAMENYELDLAVVEGKPRTQTLNSLMLDTDYIVCALSNNNPLSRRVMVRLDDLKRERMILRLPTSSTRKLFETHLASLGESIDAFEVALEVDNVATIKDLVRKDFGVSILARSACMDEVRKGKMTILPIENLSMAREMSIIYHRDFSHMDVLREILKLYHETVAENS